MLWCYVFIYLLLLFFFGGDVMLCVLLVVVVDSFFWGGRGGRGGGEEYTGWKKSCMTFETDPRHLVRAPSCPRPLLNIGSQFGQFGLGHARFVLPRHRSMLSRGCGKHVVL